MLDYETHTFANGIRLIHKQVGHSRIAHLGFLLDIGSRDEQAGEEGIAHFWEHMVFKGTKKRKAFHILNRLEAVGGDLNAYTTKEKIAFYAAVLDKHYAMAAELLTDITFGSIFPPREIEKERGVILEEMAMYLDTPDDSIFDDFDGQLFANHPLGVNILGNQETVSRFGKSDFEQFIGRNLDTSRIVFSSVANLPLRKVVAWLEKFLAHIPAQGLKPGRTKPTIQPTSHVVQRKPISQAHFVMGSPAFAWEHPDRLPFYMLCNILGGPGANSKLNLALRERNGFVYGVEAGYNAFTDCGQFHIYFATDPKRLQKSQALVAKELKGLRDKPLGAVQFHMAKEQLMGQLAMAEESNSGLMQVLGKSLLDSGRLESLAEIFAQINAVSAPQLQDLAQRMYRPEAMSTLTYLPEEN